MNIRLDHLKNKLGKYPVSMAILNLSLDSFSEPGVCEEKDILTQVIQAIESGADVLDVGAQSTRPGAVQVEEEVELQKVLNSIHLIRKVSNDICISVDTTRASVARASLGAGADIINDISGGRSLDMKGVLIDYPSSLYVLTHSHGDFSSMHDEYHYEDLLAELESYYDEALIRLSLHPSRVIYDIGIGFSKSHGQNIQALESAKKLRARIRSPVMVGISRKGFIGKMAGEVNPRKRDNASNILHTLILFTGSADVIRTHDPLQLKQAITLLSKISF